MANDEADPKTAAAPAKKGRMTPLLIVGALMAAEGVGVFFVANALSPPPAATLAGMEGSGDGSAADGAEDYAEIELAECRPSNSKSGRFVTFHVRVSALVATEDLERAQKLVASKRARLEDTVNTVIRSAEPKELNEPELGTLKRRLKHGFGEVFGDDQLVKQVLIPQWLQSSRGV